MKWNLKKEIKAKRIFYFTILVSLLCFLSVQTLVKGITYTKTISGYVTDVYGEGIDHALVELQERVGWPPTYYIVKTVYTDSSGYYTLTYTGSARFYGLKVSKSGFITQTRGIYWNNNNPQTENFQLETILPITTTFQGYVYDTKDITPVYGAVVKLYKESGEDMWTLQRFMTTGMNGYYELTSNSEDSFPHYKLEVSRKCDIAFYTFDPTYSRTYTTNFYEDAYRGHAIIIGINDFKNFETGTEYPNDLIGVEAIAYNWYDFLKNEKGFKEFIVFTDGDIAYQGNDFEGNDRLGTKANITAGVEEIADMVDSNDVIAFILVGHGHNFANSFYFDAWDSDTIPFLPWGDPTTWVHFPTIINSLEDPECKTFFFLGSCHSGKGKYDLEYWMDDDALAKSYLAAACDYDEKTSCGFYTKYFLTLSYKPNSHLSLEEIFDMAKTVLDPANNKTYYEVTECTPLESDNNGDENTYL